MIRLFFQRFIVNLTTTRIQWFAVIKTSVADYNIN